MESERNIMRRHLCGFEIPRVVVIVRLLKGFVMMCCLRTARLAARQFTGLVKPNALSKMLSLRSPLIALAALLVLAACLQFVSASPFHAGPIHRSSSSHSAHRASRTQNQQDFDLAGVWIKHDRAVPERFHINVTCLSNCPPSPASQAAPTHASRPHSSKLKKTSQLSDGGLPTYQGAYLDGPLAGLVTWNVTLVGDLMSGTGSYNNFASSELDDTDAAPLACPAPFSLIYEDDTNVVLVSYGATFGTACGDYTGDSARYYRQSAMIW
jgi:hypothetical protein